MTEKIWESFREFYDGMIGHLPHLLVALLVFAVFFFIGFSVKKIFHRRIRKTTSDSLLVIFLSRFIFFIFIVIGAILFLNILGLGKAAGGLLAGAGVSALIIGFAFKDIGENFLSGIFLAFSRPFSIGDIIEVEGRKGVALGLNMRNTQIKTYDGRDIFIPNSMLIKSPLINYTREGWLRHEFLITVPYHENLDFVKDLIVDAIGGNENIGREGRMKPFVIIEKIYPDKFDLKVLYWINYSRHRHEIVELKNDVMSRVMRELRAKAVVTA